MEKGRYCGVSEKGITIQASIIKKEPQNTVGYGESMQARQSRRQGTRSGGGDRASENIANGK